MKRTVEVFLGGTTAKGTNWREKLIKRLDVNYFNPVVENWDDEAYKLELKKRKTCDYVLYVISPLMIGVYSIAEVVDDSNKRPKKTLLCVVDNDGEDEYSKITWSKEQKKSLDAVKKMVEKNGGLIFDSLIQTALFLNNNKYISDDEK